MENVDCEALPEFALCVPEACANALETHVQHVHNSIE